MPYPQFNLKHLEEALFGPEEYVKYSNKLKGEKFPKKIIITYQGSALRYFKRKYSGKYQTLKWSSNLKILSLGNIGFVKMNGIGSPNVVTFLEELIALGAKEFINMGTAGGLGKQGIFLCEKSVRDEGTSHHYIKDGIWAYPDKALTKKLEDSLKKNKIDFAIAPSWTIDAPYRETKAEIEHYRKLGVATVEMESSAIFSVAQLRNVKVASAFAVSDVLGEKKWEPGFHKLNLKKALNGLVDVSIETLNSK